MSESVVWRCFHCAASFRAQDLIAAREHFDATSESVPECLRNALARVGIVADRNAAGLVLLRLDMHAEVCDADRDARFVAAVRVHYVRWQTDDNFITLDYMQAMQHEHMTIYGRPCEPERCGAWIADAGGALTPAECPNPRPCSEHPCEPEPGVKPDSQTYEEWRREGGKS